MEEKKGKGMIILALVFVIITGVCVYLYWGEHKEYASNNDLEEEEVLENNQYMSADGKVLFEYIGITDEAKERFVGNLMDKDYSLENIKNFAFVNGYAYAIMDSMEDETYAYYTGNFAETVMDQYSITFLIDKKNRKIIEFDGYDTIADYNEVDNLIARFTAERNDFSFVKTKAGYFFVYRANMSTYDTIYTTSAKLLGMVENCEKMEADTDGIYVYKEYNLDGTPKTDTYTKFNSNGEEIH